MVQCVGCALPQCRYLTRRYQVSSPKPRILKMNPSQFDISLLPICHVISIYISSTREVGLVDARIVHSNWGTVDLEERVCWESVVLINPCLEAWYDLPWRSRTCNLLNGLRREVGNSIRASIDSFFILSAIPKWQWACRPPAEYLVVPRSISYPILP